MFTIYSPSTMTVPTCDYYRVQIPLKKMSSEEVITARAEPVTKDNDMIHSVFNADAVWLYMPPQTSFWSQVVDSARGMTAIKQNDIEIYPPIFIYDGDDNPDFANPFNQSFVHSGVVNIDGTPLKIGDVLRTKDADGNEIVLWEDRVTKTGEFTFNIEENIERRKRRRILIHKCDGATACSPHLASYYRDALGQKNVHVFPNTIIPEDYSYNITTVRPDSPDTVRILWQGGQSHLHDWLPLKDAVRIVANKYPKTKWIFMGLELKFLHDCIPQDQLEFIPWTHYEAYRMRRTMMHVDINLCPLRDDLFNRAKSALKWYESTVSNNFEATLAQNVGPYHEIIDGETGMLFSTTEEFVQKLSQLIENAELRNRLGEAAKKWVWSNRLPQHTIPPLFNFITDLKAQQKAKLSPKIITTVPRSVKELIGGTS